MGIRSLVLAPLGDADCHTSDIGHWFAMTKTNSVILRRAQPDVRIRIPEQSEES